MDNAYVVPLADGVDWVGHVDWTVRDFHGYRTARGSSYNAYLVRGEKTALVDSVRAPYAGGLVGRVAALAPGGVIDYVVCNHAEPDHSGSLPAVMAAFPGAALVCNARCLEALSLHYDVSGWRTRVVSDGETLSLGGRTLRFLDTPMVHWPESMATYLQEDRILFSMDAFGQHIASSERFDDQLPLHEVVDAARTYYANIVAPHGRPVAAALGKLGVLGAATIAPAHGVAWRGHVGEIVGLYRDWAAAKARRKVVVLFRSMWGSTRAMATAIAEGAAAAGGVSVKLIDVTATHDTDTVTELMECAAFAAGSATLNQGMTPEMARTLCYVRGLKPRGKKGLAFGSYGWAEKAASAIDATLAEMGVERVSPPITSRFAPDAATLGKCRDAGGKLAEIALGA